MNPLDRLDLIRRRDVATAAVRAASREPSVLLPHTRTGNAITLPPTPARDLATAIRSVIELTFPGERLLGPADPVESDGWRLGGLENPSGAFPAFGPAVTCILQGEAVVCAVQVPTLDETFAAAKGAGATLNGRPLQVARPRSIEQALILSTHLDVTIPSIGEVVARLSGWRMPSPRGGVLPLFCYLATGRIDGFTAGGGDGAELAAGRLLVEEAGGVISGETDGLGALITAAATADLLEQMQRRGKVRKA